MDKKAKKRIDVLNVRMQKLRQQLAGVKQQVDDPEDAVRLEREMKDVLAELEKLKHG